MGERDSMSTIKQTFDALEEYQKEILVMLLHGGLRASKIAEQLTTVEFNTRQVATRLSRIRNRGLVVHVPSSAGAYWCLTDKGKEVALFAWLHPTR